LKAYCIALYFNEGGILYNVYCCMSLSLVPVVLYTFETILDWECQYNTVTLTEVMLPKVQG